MDTPARASKGVHTAKGLSKKLRVPVIILAAFIVVFLFCSIFDGIANFGKIHSNVTVSGLDVSGLTVEEAAQRITDEFSDDVDARSLTVYATEGGYESTVGASSTAAASTVTADGALVDVAYAADSTKTDVSCDESDAFAMKRWIISATDMGAKIDATATAEEAYAIGREGGFFSAWGQRIARWFSSEMVEYTVSLDESLFADRYTQLNKTLGTEMVDVDIAYSDGAYHTVPGSIGSKVDEDQLRADLQSGYAGHTDHAVAEMLDIPIANTEATATALAQTADTYVTTPFTLNYDAITWTIEPGTYAPWFHAVTTYDAYGNAGLELAIDLSVAKEGLAGVMGNEVFGSAVNAHATVQDGQVVIIDGTEGQGPDVNTVAQEIDTAVRTNSADRTFAVSKAISSPAIKATDIATWGLTDCLSSYYLNYDHGQTGTDRCYNIERALSFVNDSVVAPGAEWNWNDVVGECAESTGYRESTVIVNGVDTTDYGGGICNAATGVFNAAYEACLPIVDRTNHSLYLADYPEGRDATVSWDTPTLIFQNDTDHYILVHVDTDGSYMTVSIWGTATGRTCTSRNSEWSYSSDGGKSITNYRDVYDKNGTLLWEDAFYSYYRADG